VNNDDYSAKCKECVEKASQVERNAAALRKRNENGSGDQSSAEMEVLECKKCSKTLAIQEFSRSQAEKIKHCKPGKCKLCVAELKVAENTAVAAKRNNNTEKLHQQAKMKGKHGAGARLALACKETAEQAEKVTGISRRN